MAAQLDQLAELNERPNVSIRVVLYEAGAHRGLDTGPFILMRFPTTGDGRNHEPPHRVCARLHGSPVPGQTPRDRPLLRRVRGHLGQHPFPGGQFGVVPADSKGDEPTMSADLTAAT
ncbi:Scr1 family TA system antitoxin-like transcriptional regulator [Actinomadura sp. GTD37]|uniref:Scr1 family TA system antitoxin-like transcriptional regulator n=1 Tax=Actinomadura sp. GTD37 TaxID=1778030 RepID=UPI0035C04606